MTIKHFRPIQRTNLVPVILLLCSCGGGGGGAGGTTTNPPNPTIETFVSEFVLEPVKRITPSGTNLYVGTGMGLLEINKVTGSKRAVAGNTYIFPPGGSEAEEMDYAGMVSGNTAYLGLKRGRIGSTTVSLDGATAIELNVPQHAILGTANFSTIAANSTHTFWSGVSGGSDPINVFGQPHGQPGSGLPMLSVAGVYAELAASDGVVYLYVDGGGAAPNNFRRVYRYVTATGQSTLLYDQPRATTDITTVLPIAADATGAYWSNGAEILFAGVGSPSGQSVISLADRVISLVIDNTGLYAYHIENYSLTVPNPTSRRVITKVTTGPLATAELVRLVYDTTDSLVFAVYSGELYFAVHEYNGTTWATTLYHRNASGGFDPLLAATQDYAMIGVTGLVASNGKLALAGNDDHSFGSKLLLYDLGNTSVVELRPATRATRLVRSGNKIYMAGIGNVGISSLDLSLPLRQVQEINNSDPPSGFMPIGGTQAGGYLYFYGIYGADPSTYWRIVKMLPDGSQYQTMVQLSGELRDPVVLGNTLFFLCHTSCGDPGWVLASIPLTGGSPNPEYLVLEKPRLYIHNGILYLAGTPDGDLGNIHAIDPSTNQVALVLGDIPYSQLTLAFTDGWLYWGGFQVLPDGAPARAIARHPWLSQTTVGSKVTIIEGTHLDVIYLSEYTIATDASHLYFWDAGLKRVVH